MIPEGFLKKRKKIYTNISFRINNCKNPSIELLPTSFFKIRDN